MKNKGWVRLHRKIEDNPLWFMEPFTRAQAWIDLFLMANHKDAKVLIKGMYIDIKRGQIAWSEVTMSRRWQWSRNKVRRFLKYLETEQQIEQQKSNVTTIITIPRYDEYNGEAEQRTIQQKDSRRNTNNNEKNVKNEKKLVRDEDFEKILNTWNATMESKFKTLPEKNIKYWLTKYSLQEVLEAVENIPYHEWLSDKAKPDMFFRQSDGKGNAVDRIGECLSVRRTNKMFDKNKQL